MPAQRVLSIHQRNPGTGHARVGFAFEPRAWDGEPGLRRMHLASYRFDISTRYIGRPAHDLPPETEAA